LLVKTVRIARDTTKICWDRLPNSVQSSWVFRKLGKLIHQAHVRWQGRVQGCQYTYFLRNVPQLEVLRDLALKVPAGGTWRVISVGRSSGAELYSLLWYLRSARADLQISAVGVDIADALVAKASRGEYSPENDELSLLSNPLLEVLFDHAVGSIKVKDWVRKDIRWLVADAIDPNLLDVVGPADLLLANNFLGVLPEQKAETLMENLLRLVLPGGYFVLNGDLDVKTRFAKKHGLVPISERIEAVHFGDPTKIQWPWYHSSPEPIEESRPDWQTRYAQVFAKPS
jgi:chemotaxis methyl-accepting protein methylase